MAGKIQISHLSHKISLDAGDFAETSIASRKEVAQFRKSLRELRDPMERYEKDLKDAESLLQFGADGQELYNRALLKAEKRLKDATGETEKLRMAEKKMTEDRRKGDAIMERHLSQHNRLQRELKETERLFQSGVIDVRHYRLEIDRLNREMGEGTMFQQLGARFGSAFGFDQMFGATGGQIAGQVAMIGGAVTLAATYARTLQRAGEFAIDRFNKDREAIDKLAKSSRALNVDLEKLTGFQFIFGQSAGVSDEGTVKIFQELSKRSSEAAQGLGESRLAFAEMGLDAKELARLAPDKQMLKIADAMERVELRSDRLRLAGRLFGEEQGKAFIALEGGAESLQKMLDRSERLGFAISEDDAAKVEAMNDAIDTLSRSFEAFSRELTIQATPVVLDLVGELQTMFEIVMENKDLLSIMFDNTILSSLRSATLLLDQFNTQLAFGANIYNSIFGTEFAQMPGGMQDNPLGIKAFGEDGGGKSFDPAASIMSGSREAFQAQYRVEVDGQLEVAKEQRDIARDTLEVQRGMAGALIDMAGKMEQSI